MQIEIRLSGCDEMMDRLEAFGTEALLGAAEPALAQALTAIQDEAAANCPVDTGALRSSLNTRMQREDGARIGEVYAGAPYALPVEMGSAAAGGERPAQPFLYPAFKANQGRVTDEIIRAIAEYTRSGGTGG